MNKRVSVIIPAYNEEKNIEKTIHSLKNITIINNIYIVDDGSEDNTSEIVETIGGVELIRLGRNMGKGSAMKKGLEVAIDSSDIIVFLDADLQESGTEVEKLIIPLLHEEVDVTIAKFPKATTIGGVGLVKGLARLGVLLHTGKDITTTLSGQRGYKKEVLENIQLMNDGFGVECSMTIDILKKGYTIKEVEVLMQHRETERNLKGFLHRGKQFIDIFKVIYLKKIQGLK